MTQEELDKRLEYLFLGVKRSKSTDEEQSYLQNVDELIQDYQLGDNLIIKYLSKFDSTSIGQILHFQKISEITLKQIINSPNYYKNYMKFIIENENISNEIKEELKLLQEII